MGGFQVSITLENRKNRHRTSEYEIAWNIRIDIYRCWE